MYVCMARPGAGAVDGISLVGIFELSAHSHFLGLFAAAVVWERDYGEEGLSGRGCS